MDSLREGFLNKRGPTISYRWERRYCVLTASQLSWFRDDTKSERIGYVDNTPGMVLTPFSGSCAPGDSIKHVNEKPFGFAFDPDPDAGKKRRIFYFDAEDEETLNLWVAAVQEADVAGNNVPADSQALEVAIVEIGDDGAFIRRDGSVKSFDQASAIYLVLDPRASPNICKADLRTSFQNLAAKTTIFLLLPSLTSRPEFLLFAEISLQYLACICDILGPDIDYAEKKVRAVRIDDYMYHGEKILEVMMREDGVFYPEEERTAVLGLLRQFEPQIWNFRAWCHWVIGMGREEGEILSIQKQVFVQMISNGAGCYFSFPYDPLPFELCGTRAVLGTAQSALFIAFSDDSAKKYSEIFGQEVVKCDYNAGDLLESDKYAIFLVEQSDLVWSPGEYSCGPIVLCGKYRERFPDTPLTIILFYEDYESLTKDKWLPFALHNYIENCDAVIFATIAEAPQVSTFFTKTKYKSENVARALAMNFCAFPRLHFFTMSTAMGMEIQPSSIMFPALTVGQPAGSEISPDLFKAASGNLVMALAGQDNKPMIERVLPADEGESATVIVPAVLIIKTLTDLIKQTFGERSEDDNCEQPQATMVSIYGEEFAGVADDMELLEVRSNVEGLAMEYQAYLDSTIPNEEEGMLETVEDTQQMASAIIEIGDDGALCRCGDTSVTLEDAGSILLVLDPRSPRNMRMAKLGEKFAGLESKITIFLLMPSQSSSPESLLCAEIALQFFSCVCQLQSGAISWESNLETKKIRIVRIDDWFHLRTQILLQMMEEDKLYYPIEERDAMLNLLSEQFPKNIYNYRGWCHWVVGEGVMDSEITEVHQSLLIPMLESGYGLACIEPAPLEVSSNKAIQGTAQKPKLVAFSEDAAGRYSAECGSDVVPCTGLEQSETLWTGAEYPIFLVESRDIAWPPGTYGCLPMKVCSRYRESYPSNIVTIVFLYEDFESFLNDKWLVHALPLCIDNADNVVFATQQEAPQVGDFFTKAQSNTENVARALCMSFVPFPRLHFFTLSTSMGQELEAGSILFPALTVGSPAGSGIPADMFKAGGGNMAMMLSDTNGMPLVDRVIPGVEGASATMIAQGKLVITLINGLLERTFGEDKAAEWTTIYGEEYQGVAHDAELQQSRDNLSDLVMEYSQYLQAGQEEDYE